MSESTGVPSTGSPGTRRLLGAIAAGVALLVWFSFVVTPADIEMEDMVRLMYVHVPSAIMTYVFFGLCGLGSAVVLWRRSRWWDMVAGSAAEIGVVFGVLTLLTGMIWGRPTWGTYWEWGDVRLVSTLILVLLYIGYLALRGTTGLTGEPSRPAAVVGLMSLAMIPIVSRSVEWWENRTLHQQATVTTLDPEIEGTMLFTLFLGMVVFALIGAWLAVHRFRIAHLEAQYEMTGLEAAVSERRAETADVDAAVTVGPTAAPPEEPT